MNPVELACCGKLKLPEAGVSEYNGQVIMLPSPPWLQLV